MARMAGAVGVLLVFSCGCVPDAPRVDARTDQIIGGIPSPDDPAVVAFAAATDAGFRPFCTGTLIAPRTVLTAGHCLFAAGRDVDYAVLFGQHSRTPTRVVPVLEQRDGALDIGVLRLAEAVTDVAFLPMNERPMTADLLGEPIRHAGFGLNEFEPPGSRRQVTTPLDSITSSHISTSTAERVTCHGDSGGPGLMRLPGNTGEQIVGVVSFGDGACHQDGWDVRVDVVVESVYRIMSTWETTCRDDTGCVPGCVPVDQDCACVSDGVCSVDCVDPTQDTDCPFDCRRNSICATEACALPDVDCVAEGSHCVLPVQCRARLCGTDPQRGETYCTSPCVTDSDCLAPLECGEGVCRFPQRPVRQMLETCEATRDFCAEGGVCAGPAGGFSRCVPRCVTTSDCPSGSRCEASAASQRFCRPRGVPFVAPTLPFAGEIIGTAERGGCSASAGPLAMCLVVMLLRRTSRRAPLVRRGARAAVARRLLAGDGHSLAATPGGETRRRCAGCRR